MRGTSSHLVIDERQSCTSDEGVERDDREEAIDNDLFWPPPREWLHRTTIEVLSLHNLPKVGPRPTERRPSTVCVNVSGLMKRSCTQTNTTRPSSCHKTLRACPLAHNITSLSRCLCLPHSTRRGDRFSPGAEATVIDTTSSSAARSCHPKYRSRAHRHYHFRCTRLEVLREVLTTHCQADVPGSS